MAARKGRLVKMTPEAVATILRYVAAGVPMKFAAPHAGLTDRSVNRWLAKGRAEKPGGPFASFLSAVKKAESEAVAVRLLRISKAGQGGAVVERTTKTVTDSEGKSVTTVSEKYTRPEWTADAWHLERTHEATFATNKRELAELRRRLQQLESDRGTDGSRRGTTEAVGLPPVERDDGPDGGRPADEAPR